MSGKTRHLCERSGRFFARFVIPRDLRPYLDNKTERRTALGADRRMALAKLPGAVAAIQHEIAIAERMASAATGKPIELGRYPLSVDQIAVRNYQERLAFDDLLRNSGSVYASIGIDDQLVARLRDGISGRLPDDQLETLVGERIDRYRYLGNTTVAKGTGEWRTLALSLCISELEALARVAERDEGDYTGKPENPIIANAKTVEEEKPPVSIKGLFNSYLGELKANGKGAGAEKRWTGVIDDLVRFARSDDANRLTKKTFIDWKDAKLATLAPRTVKDVYLTAAKAVLNWAVTNDLLSENPAQHVKFRVAPKVLNRPKGFTMSEVTAVLFHSLNYEPQSHNNRIRELPQTSAAKKWAPLLCAFTGSRISEMTQLRKEDIRSENNVTILRITPEAGTVKTRRFRDVPLHPQVVELGFLDFVNSSPDGPLFYTDSGRKPSATPAQMVSGRVSEWLQKQGVIPKGVSPNHGWRHCFKTVGRELEIDTRILDAIQGHSGKTEVPLVC